jgi:2-polyprenyl-6-methoxyphenol hydroxylase-like FAD-dependent oxidoreductase
VTPDERQVSIGFSDGSRWDYDLVVGADGLHSTVRELTFGVVSIGYTGWMIQRSVLPPLHLQGIEGFTVLLGERSFFGLMPTGDGLTYGFGGVGTPQVHDPLEGRLERFRQRFGAFGGPVPAYLAALSRDEQLHGGPIEWVEVDRWHWGRVVLVGDAAHAGPPMMAQGGCMAMEDAWVLAEVLHTADSVEQALETYVTRRRSRAEWVQQHSRAVAERVLEPPAIRDAGLREQEGQAFLDRFKPLIPAP